jgi:RNA polymerase sigma factor (sigma-70 family)
MGVAVNLVNEYRNKWTCLQYEEFDDLLQECLVHWYFVRDKYDPGRGVYNNTFMAKVIRNKLGHIVEKLTTDKRVTNSKTVSLDAPIGDDEDAPTLLDTLDENPLSENLQTQIGLPLDVAKAYAHLTQRQRALCKLILEEGLNTDEAAKALRVSRNTVKNDKNRIKAAFAKAELREYME